MNDKSQSSHLPAHRNGLKLALIGLSALALPAIVPAVTFNWGGSDPALGASDAVVTYVPYGASFTPSVVASGLTVDYEFYDVLSMSTSRYPLPNGPTPISGPGPTLGPISKTWTADLDAGEGQSSITITVSVIGDDNASDFRTIVPVGITLQPCSRIGISANGHNRTKILHVQVNPPAEACNVALTVGAHLAISDVQNVAGNISFSLAGVDQSTGPEGDTYVLATHCSGISSKMAMSVIVPFAFGPRPQFSGVVPGVNFVRWPGSVPPAYPIDVPPEKDRLLGTTYETVLTVPIVDQYDHPCGDLYEGAEIFEGGYDLKQQLSAGSSYQDPCGPQSLEGWTPHADQLVTDWPRMPVLALAPAPGETDCSIEIKVDNNFELYNSITDATVGLVRTIQWTEMSGPPLSTTITITW